MNKYLKYIGIYQIVGGLISAGAVIWATTLMISNGTLKNSTIPSSELIYTFAVFGFALIVYIISVIAGYLLIKDSGKGLVLSIIVQSLQAPFLMVKGLTYYLSSGIITIFNVGKTPEYNFNFNLQAYFLEFFNITKGEDNGIFLIGINIIAVLILIYLIKLRFKKSN